MGSGPTTTTVVEVALEALSPGPDACSSALIVEECTVAGREDVQRMVVAARDAAGGDRMVLIARAFLREWLDVRINDKPIRGQQYLHSRDHQDGDSVDLREAVVARASEVLRALTSKERHAF